LWLPLILKPKSFIYDFKNYSKGVKSNMLLPLILYVVPNLCQIVYTVACQHPQCLFFCPKKVYKIINFWKNILKFLRSDLWEFSWPFSNCWEPLSLRREFFPWKKIWYLGCSCKPPILKNGKNQGGSHTDGSLKLVRTTQNCLFSLTTKLLWRTTTNKG
jgi:hypothetical protein